MSGTNDTYSDPLSSGTAGTPETPVRHGIAEVVTRQDTRDSAEIRTVGAGAEPDDSEVDEWTGKTIAGRYVLLRQLGRGGMGAVYEAQNALGKRFAVKLLLKDEFAQDQTLVSRFIREAKASAVIDSRHVVEVFDTGLDEMTGAPFILMELLRGEDLEQMVFRAGALNPVGATRLIAQAAEGLAAAHAAGVIHRDIKPANLFLAQRGSEVIVKLLDFGIAKHTLDLSSLEGAGLTKTGTMIGTPIYMSPEQAQGAKNLDGRSDVWALGMCLYEALSGQRPWSDTASLGALILAICSRDILPLRTLAPWIDPKLAEVVTWALQRNLADRCPSAEAFLNALTPHCEGRTTLAAAELAPSQAVPSARVSQNDGAVATNPTIAAPSLPPAGLSLSKNGFNDANEKGLSTVGPGLAQTQAAATYQISANTTTQSKRTTSMPWLGVGMVAVVAVVAVVVIAIGRQTNRPVASGTSGAESRPSSVVYVSSYVSSSSVPSSSIPTSTTGVVTTTATSVSVPVRAAKGSTFRLDGKDLLLKDGKFTLTGPAGSSFFVSVYEPGRAVFLQQIVLLDTGCEPAEVDTARGVVVVKKPTSSGVVPAKTAVPTKPTGAASYDKTFPD